MASLASRHVRIDSVHNSYASLSFVGLQDAVTPSLSSAGPLAS